MGADSKQPDAERRLPGGVGTLVFAGRLVQAGGGRIVSINGKGVPGHDIRWVTKLGNTVLVERKDRSYEAGLGDTAEKHIKKVIAEVRNAAETMPRATHPALAASWSSGSSTLFARTRPRAWTRATKPA